MSKIERQWQTANVESGPAAWLTHCSRIFCLHQRILPGRRVLPVRTGPAFNPTLPQKHMCEMLGPWPNVQESYRMDQALGPSWSNNNQPNHHQRAPAISPASRHGRSSPSSNRMPGGWLGRDNGHGADDKLATSGNIQQQNAHQRLLHVASCCGPPHASAAESGKKLWFGCIASHLTSSPRNSHGLSTRVSPIAQAPT